MDHLSGRKKKGQPFVSIIEMSRLLIHSFISLFSRHCAKSLGNNTLSLVITGRECPQSVSPRGLYPQNEHLSCTRDLRKDFLCVCEREILKGKLGVTKKHQERYLRASALPRPELGSA